MIYQSIAVFTSSRHPIQSIQSFLAHICHAMSNAKNLPCHIMLAHIQPSPWSASTVLTSLPCRSPANNLRKVYLAPALYDKEPSSKSMEAYFRDIGVYLDWMQDIEFKNGTTQYQRVSTVFHASQVQRGIDLLVQTLLKAGDYCAQLSIQVGNMIHYRHYGWKRNIIGARMTPDAVLHTLASLNWLEAIEPTSRLCSRLITRSRSLVMLDIRGAMALPMDQSKSDGLAS